ncbi:MAG TPA: 16S rRNA (cytosine(967)-C(5))-methyltransferase RsmB [Candidatus Manganitrophaceae bacterium]|nr:16S rRNA (cytosine(967)-C(5))-methyltransferase RsmB [Candidatus Manganitrophaceae bacterium]
MRSKAKPPSAREGAWFLLNEAEASQSDLSALIDDYLKRYPLERRERALLTELVYGVFRQRGFLDWEIDRFSKVSLHLPIRNVLRLGLYQLLFLDKIPPSAAVNTAVDLAKGAEGVAAGRLVNGLLRNILRQKANLPRPDPADRTAFIAVTTSHPEWLVRRWIERWGEERTVALCRFNNETPPTTLRVNFLKTDRETLIKMLEKEGAEVAPTPNSPAGLYVSGVSLRSLPSYQAGHFYIQDEGAQLISDLVDPRPGESILDLCAAPGGKTTHLAELMMGKGEVVATDIDPGRIASIRENLARLQTPAVSIQTIDGATAPGRLYDRIVVDAPCTALGILRRIPEGKWRKKPALIPAFAKEQRQLLEKAAGHLKNGGRLVYATCSTEPEENEAVVEAFAADHPELKIENPAESLPAAARKYINPKGYFTTLLNSDRMDQFFAARWIRRG